MHILYAFSLGLEEVLIKTADSRKLADEESKKLKLMMHPRVSEARIML
jgi:hypothetical protein